MTSPLGSPATPPQPEVPARKEGGAKRLKIAIITQYFPPDGASQIPEQVASELSARGHRVKVLTTYPHYSEGKLSHGYRQRLRTDEQFRGASVRRIPILASHTRNPIGRIANYLSFVVSARFSRKFIDDSDVVYVYGTPATVAEPARAWSKSNGVPFVYHVQDIWPESVTQSGFLPQRILGGITNAINGWLSKVYSSASAVITIAPTAKDLLIQRGVPPERSHLVYNWSDVVECRNRTYEDGLSLLYAGNLGEFQDLDTIIHAAHALAEFPGFRLRIAGGGVVEDRLKSLVSSLGMHGTVDFLGQVDQKDMAPLYAETDFQIVSLKKLNIFEGTIPSKFQAGLAHGVPVITTVQGDVSQLVTQNGLGLVAQPENPESVAEAFRTAYELSEVEKAAYSERARRFFTESFTLERALDQIEAILLDVADSRSSRDRKS